MTRDETKQILMMMQAAYPNWKPDDLATTLNAWTVMLEDFKFDEIIQALKLYILSNNTAFAPSIGQLVDKVNSVKILSGEKDELGELEAWALVYKAISRSGYYSEEEFAKLPETVQKAVGSPANLKEWAQMPSETVLSVEQSHFIRSYRAEKERSRIMNLVPENVLRIATEKSKDKLQIGESNGK